MIASRLVACLALLTAACSSGAAEPDPTCLGPLPEATPAPAALDAPAVADPVEYLSLHNALGRPGTPEWPATLQRLMAAGDGFTLERLKALDRVRVPADSMALLDAAIEMLGARVAAETPATVAASLQTRFERASLADLHCDPLEMTLVPWVLSGAAALAAEPVVRAELQRLESGYVAPDVPWTVRTGLLPASASAPPLLQARVRGYAHRALSPTPDVAARR